MNAIAMDSNYWAYSVKIPLVLILLNLILFRKKMEFINLTWVLGIYLVFALLIMHVVGANVAYTFRRGFFKVILLFYVYLASSGMIVKVSNWISKISERPVNS